MRAITTAETAPPLPPFPWVRFIVGGIAGALLATGAVWVVDTEGLLRIDATTTMAALATARPALEIAAATLFATFAAWRVRRALSW